MSHTQENRYLGEGNILKLLLKFSIPCILSLLLSSVYNLVTKFLSATVN